MLNIGSVVLGVEDVQRATEFWTTALNYERRDPPDRDDDTWVILKPPGGGPQLALMLSETPVQQHPRIHLDLYADDMNSEIDRLKNLGALDVAWDLYPDNADFIVLADPDGNRFCVIEKAPAPEEPARRRAPSVGFINLL